ncbi:MAG: hypothetical protein ABII27_00040 [bacterium]
MMLNIDNEFVKNIANKFSEIFPKNKMYYSQLSNKDEIFVYVDKYIYDTEKYKDFIFDIKINYLYKNGIANIFFSCLYPGEKLSIIEIGIGDDYSKNELIELADVLKYQDVVQELSSEYLQSVGSKPKLFVKGIVCPNKYAEIGEEEFQKLIGKQLTFLHDDLIKSKEIIVSHKNEDYGSERCLECLQAA